MVEKLCVGSRALVAPPQKIANKNGYMPRQDKQ